MTARTTTRLAAALLVVEALLIVSPVLAVSNLFTGAGLLGKSVAFVRVWDLGGQAAAYLLSPLTVLLLLLAAWGVWHGTRGIGALLLQVPVAAGGAVPFLRPFSPASVIPQGAWLLVALALATTVLLVVRLRARPEPADAPRRHRRWWWLAAFGTAVGAVAVVAGTSRSLPFDPTARLLPAFAGSDPGVTARPRGPAPAQNPALAGNPWNSIHNDAWATDTYAIPAPPEPSTARVESVFTGGDCATITFDSRGRLVTLCSTLTRVIAFVIDPRSLTVLAQQVVGSRSPDPTDFSGGGYFVLDDRDRIVTATQDGALLVLSTGRDRPYIAQEERYDVTATLQPGERVTSVQPGWDGRYWYVGNRGTVGVTDPVTGASRARNLGGESVENSFAVDESGAYVVTGAALYRLRADASGRPDVVWRTPYDTGVDQKPGQTSRASGTTPTVFAGGRLVTITDNAHPRMHLLVLRTRDGGVTCEVPVFAEGHSATENSIIAARDVLVVANNDGYAPPVTATTGGHTTTPGMAAVAVDAPDGSCAPRWSNDTLSAPSVVSKATLAGDLVVTYTKPGSGLGADGWYFTGVDLRDGHLVWRRLAGAGAAFNNHYAGAFLGPGGDLFVGTLMGIAVLRAPA